MNSDSKTDVGSNELTDRLPRHVAIIMDGNGRWARNKGFGRTWGHREGAKRVDEIVTECCHLGIRYLTLYAFSTENWNRPHYEVNMLMRLLVQHLRIMDRKLVKNRVSLLAQGSIERLPKFVQTELSRVVRKTSFSDPRLYLNLSLSYGGRKEIVDCARAWAEMVASGECSAEDIDENTFRKHLYQPNVPDPDLLIRTGGEWRISNFLLWEIAYTEIVVTQVLWPDFRVPELHEALTTFANRQRRFGMTSEQVANPLPTRVVQHEA
jgi:undecaprenyl diphosphate synthase